ncbi:MAG: hypothetical protein UW03_C0003G0023 [Candidatus Peregrinibacteria bacterium GW2011_GWA2_43_8]|nr:MAG: hypothetical protein UW03_C0003G0023 [Candidatus Peregrinibacteria bacterium GW2011_GWA2_43_8]
MGTMGHYRPNLSNITRKKPIKKTGFLETNTEKKILKNRLTQRRFSKILRPIVLILIGLTLYGISYIFIISDIFAIKKTDYDHDQIQVEDENPILAYMQNFKGTNIFLLNEADEENYLKSTYPQYKKVNIKKSLPGTLILELEEYAMVANLIYEQDGISRKFIINENGIAINTDTEDLSLPYVYFETDKVPTENQEVIKPEILQFILEAINDFESKFGMQILDTTYYKIAREVHLQTERYFYVWLDTELTVDEQLLKLKLSLPKLDIYEEDLKYIDLRISGQTGDKVVYMLN